ncbi:OmpA family protein [Defluviimonas sp. WL0024]|uniref:OmpA family protein n=1 Tax=Albidovulum salinarum TaxID=2984153 RepID=A0ABT2X7E9_9RHOB|nr:OmpA family protein [Defluviimonas sp. WL0024]MCU9849870.1 OmpA family protein [Defluviimonas sp. WL0024]
MKAFRGSLALVLAATVFSASSAAAQSADDMTADEIIDAFEKQKTRGLVLVPADEAAAGETAAGTDAATSGETVVATDPATTEPAATETTQVVAAPQYQPVAADEQVYLNISFDFDSAALREDQKPRLVTMCEVMKSVDVQLFQIVGHTDSSGSDEYNEALSLLRAEEIKRHLVGCGVAPERLQAIGMGESTPLNADDPAGEENRRVEFQALS